MTHEEAVELWKLFRRDHGSDPHPHDVGVLLISIERKEREACAKIADQHDNDGEDLPETPWTHGWKACARDIAHDIRARKGNQA